MIQTIKQKIILIFILLFLAVGAFFMVNVELPSWSYLLSSINVLLFALPVFWITKRWLGWRDALILFLALGIFALLIETNAIITGFPYGHFGYSELLGYKLFGYAPWTVAFAWTPLLLSAYSISANLFKNIALRITSTALILIWFDLTLDAGAVLLGFWKYKDGGFFYGVPFLNFVGWAFSGVLGTILLEVLLKIFKPLLPIPAQLINSSFFIIFFWTAIAVFGGLYIPAAIGIVAIIGLFFFYQKFSYRFEEMIVLV
ncbi:MAG TPA: carotenoid biosynthesis protein, partial [Pyrinomonadaceae bacterium]|nr:carotenoid biosynthesis protein [Pyrinomonadaceae bacterium]